MAVVAPFIIFSVWKKENKDDVSGNDKLTPFVPNDNSKYVEIDQATEVRRKVTDIKPEEENKEEDVWDNYSAPKPVLTEEMKQKDLEDIIKKEEPIVEPIVNTSPITEPKVPVQEPVVPIEQPTTQVQEPVIPEPEIPSSNQFEEIFQQIKEQEDSNS